MRLLSPCTIVTSLCNFQVCNFVFLLTDIDDCTNETNSCHEKATCENVPGGFTCDCVKGYDGNGTLCTGILLLVTYFIAV